MSNKKNIDLFGTKCFYQRKDFKVNEYAFIGEGNGVVALIGWGFLGEHDIYMFPKSKKELRFSKEVAQVMPEAKGNRKFFGRKVSVKNPDAFEEQVSGQLRLLGYSEYDGGRMLLVKEEDLGTVNIIHLKGNIKDILFLD